MGHAVRATNQSPIQAHTQAIQALAFGHDVARAEQTGQKRTPYEVPIVERSLVFKGFPKD